MSLRAHALSLLSSFALSASVALSGCGEPGAAQPDIVPTGVKRVSLTSSGFTAPADAVASPDGATFYFSAKSASGDPALFRIPSQPGSQATALVSGAPLLTPGALVLSCDGATLYAAPGGRGGAAIYSLATAGGPLTALAVTGIAEVDGLAVGPDCATLFATGITPDSRAALFKVPMGGGAAQVVYVGAPLISPGSLYVDSQSVAWVMDRLGSVATLFAIPADGSAALKISGGLQVASRGGGVSLNSAGKTAVMSTLSAQGTGQLTTIELSTSNRTDVPAADMLGPTGLRTARSAPVFAIADTAGNAIFRAD